MVHGVTIGYLAGNPPDPILLLPDLHKLEGRQLEGRRHKLAVLRMEKT